MDTHACYLSLLPTLHRLGFDKGNHSMPATATAPNSYTTVNINKLRVGTKLKSPIFDARDDREILLLAAGTTITRQQLTRLVARGIGFVRVAQSELADVVEQESAPIHAPETPEETRRKYRANSFIKSINSQPSGHYDEEQKKEFELSYQESLHQVENMFDALTEGMASDTVAIAESASASLVKVAEDLDMFVSLGVEPEQDRYPCRHSMQTAMLAMSIGTINGLSKDELMDLGIGCFVHDVGMIRLSEQLVDAERSLNQMEFLEITKHPAMTFDMVRHLKSVPNGARMVAYQMHERCNGSGYPRQRNARQIHQLAKIAAVSDVYLALVSNRPYRPGRLPYDAMETLLHEARKGLYDADVIRCLLETVSLFPIGSYVELSDSRVARVLRSNRENYTRPVVETWFPGQFQAPSQLVDLSQETDLNVVRPLPSLKTLTDSEGIDEQYINDFWD